MGRIPALLTGWLPTPDELTSKAVLVAWVRWAAVGLGVAQAYVTSPAPISTTGVLALTALLALYNIPATLASRLPRRALSALLVTTVVGDFTVCTGWVLLLANDRYSTSYAIYCLVGIEAALIYSFRGGLVLLGGFATAMIVLYWERLTYFNYPVEVGSATFRTAIVVLVTLFAAGNARQILRERKARWEAEQRAITALEHRALHDPLTGLPNRDLFFDRLEQAMAMSKRDSAAFAVLMIDLDGFKSINDTFGHQVGDAVLREVAGRLRSAVRETDTVARLGGDEFAMIPAGAPNREEAVGIAIKVQAGFREMPFIVGGQHSILGASIGIAVFPDDAQDAAALINCADIAMYAAKRQGGGFGVYGRRDGPADRRTSEGAAASASRE